MLSLVHWASQGYQVGQSWFSLQKSMRSSSHHLIFHNVWKQLPALFVSSDSHGPIWAWPACHSPDPPSWQKEWLFLSSSPRGTAPVCPNLSNIIERGLAMTWPALPAGFLPAAWRKPSSTGSLTMVMMWRCGFCLWRWAEELLGAPVQRGTSFHLPSNPYSASADAAHSCTSCFILIKSLCLFFQ